VSLNKIAKLADWPVWKGLDKHIFLGVDMAILCSDKDLYADVKMYNILRLLQDAGFLFHHGNFTKEKLKDGKKAAEEFCELYKRKFKENHCTIKFHILQHYGDIAERHGPAFLQDGFNYEQTLGRMKGDITTT
jgi:hypothetical protein